MTRLEDTYTHTIDYRSLPLRHTESDMYSVQTMMGIHFYFPFRLNMVLSGRNKNANMDKIPE